MKKHVISIKATAWLTGVSLVALLVIHNDCRGREADFWCNIFLAVFGSGLLTFITSCIGYSTEKVRTLEAFSYSTRSLLHIINKYDLDWDLERKINFFLEYSDVDKSLWDGQLGAICFLWDPDREQFTYIFEKIYKPILDLNQKIAEHEWHFRWHLDGSGKNDRVMMDFISEIEPLFMKKITKEYPMDDGRTMNMTSTQNVLVHSILEELNGRYYDIMYHGKADQSSTE